MSFLWLRQTHPAFRGNWQTAMIITEALSVLSPSPGRIPLRILSYSCFQHCYFTHMYSQSYRAVTLKLWTWLKLGVSFYYFLIMWTWLYNQKEGGKSGLSPLRKAIKHIIALFGIIPFMPLKQCAPSN